MPISKIDFGWINLDIIDKTLPWNPPLNIRGFNTFCQVSLLNSCNIFGSCCDRLENYTSYKNIVLHGRIDNLSIAYDNSDLVINPVLFGGGLKIKNVEALANGLPLITTNEGANGIEDGINKSFLLANTVNEWIDSILSLMLSSSLREQLSKNALEYAKNNFSDDICYGELVKKIKDNTWI